MNVSNSGAATVEEPIHTSMHTMLLDEETLERVAKDGQMDYEKWPGILDPLLERLDNIACHNFPIPRAPSTTSFDTVPTIPLQSSCPTVAADSQQNSNKENAPPASQSQSSSQRPPVPSFPSSETADRVPDSQPLPGTVDALPPPLIATIASTKSTLRTYFSQNPPHTIQRLAELILRPNLHYKTLPAYLRAVDRVVSVSSGADIFPLPVSIPMPSTMVDSTLANGVNGSGNGGFVFSDNSLGSDESLGGALLTPIPWLTNSTPPPDDGDILSGPAPNPQSNSSGGSLDARVQRDGSGAQGTAPIATGEEEGGQLPDAEDGEDIPHARGPTVLGVEDMGLQDGKGVRMSLTPAQGDPSTTEPSSGNQPADKPTGEDSTGDADADADGDGDIEITDAGVQENSQPATGGSEISNKKNGDTDTLNE